MTAAANETERTPYTVEAAIIDGCVVAEGALDLLREGVRRVAEWAYNREARRFNAAQNGGSGA